MPRRLLRCGEELRFSPPCRSTISLVAQSPSPVPTSSLVVKNGSKTRSKCSGATPSPSSATTSKAKPTQTRLHREPPIRARTPLSCAAPSDILRERDTRTSPRLALEGRDRPPMDLCSMVNEYCRIEARLACWFKGVKKRIGELKGANFCNGKSYSNDPGARAAAL